MNEQGQHRTQEHPAAREEAATEEELQQRQRLAEAKFLLMKRRGMDEPGAHRFLQKESMNRRKPLRDIVAAVLLSEQLRVG